MGVDFFPCDKCGKSICDYGDYFRCEKCDRKLCEDCRKGIYDAETGEERCPFCACEEATDFQLLRFALAKLGMTRAKLRKEYKASRGRVPRAARNRAEGGASPEKR